MHLYGPIDVWEKGIQIQVADLQCNGVLIDSKLIFSHVDYSRFEGLGICMPLSITSDGESGGDAPF